MAYSKLTKINKLAGFGKRKVKPPEATLRPRGAEDTDLPEDIRALIPRMGERQARIVWQWRKKGLRASAPEALVYDWLTKKNVPFEFQSSFFGGRIYRGGLVNDFALYHLPQGVMIWRIQGEYYHAPTREKDEANKQRLLMSRVKNRKVVAVVDLWERDLYRGVDGVCRDALTGRGRRG